MKGDLTANVEKNGKKFIRKLNSEDKSKEEQINGYMQAIDKLLSIHDNEFRELLSYSNEG